MPPHSDVPAILGGTPIRPEGPPDWPFPDRDVAARVERALADGSWGKYHGPHVAELADLLAACHHVEHVVLCASGTAAVELALRGLAIGPGDDVILAAYDFKGNFQDVLAVGAVPVLVDVRPENWTIDPARIPEAVGSKTKAIVVSHLHGGVVDMPEIVRIASAHRLAVIEDAAQMPGARIHGRVAGTWGDAGILSFGGSKLVTAGRGGAVLTSRADVAQRIKLYTQRGNDAYPLSELQAAAVIPQWARLDADNTRRKAAVDWLAGRLGRFGGLKVFSNPPSDSQPGYYKLGFQYDAAALAGLPRDAFAAAVRAEGIALDSGFRGLHKTHSSQRFRPGGELPHATRADAGVLTLHHPVLLESEHEWQQIVTAIERVSHCAEAIAQRQRQQTEMLPSQKIGMNEPQRHIMLDYGAKFDTGLAYHDFLAKYGTEEQRRRWESVHEKVNLTPAQRELLAGFKREMKVLCLTGAWCGDCVNQCPIFEHFAIASRRIQVRYFDRDANPDLGQALSICGGARVPVVLFLSEDNTQMGWYGDRTLSKYRKMVADEFGLACPTGLIPEQDSLLAAVTQDWLNEFERIQLILRTSARLRKLHND